MQPRSIVLGSPYIIENHSEVDQDRLSWEKNPNIASDFSSPVDLSLEIFLVFGRSLSRNHVGSITRRGFSSRNASHRISDPPSCASKQQGCRRGFLSSLEIRSSPSRVAGCSSRKHRSFRPGISLSLGTVRGILSRDPSSCLRTVVNTDFLSSVGLSSVNLSLFWRLPSAEIFLLSSNSRGVSSPWISLSKITAELVSRRISDPTFCPLNSKVVPLHGHPTSLTDIRVHCLLRATWCF